MDIVRPKNLLSRGKIEGVYRLLETVLYMESVPYREGLLRWTCSCPMVTFCIRVCTWNHSNKDTVLW